MYEASDVIIYIKKEESRMIFPILTPYIIFIYYIKRYTFVAGTTEAKKLTKTTEFSFLSFNMP